MFSRDRILRMLFADSVCALCTCECTRLGVKCEKLYSFFLCRSVLAMDAHFGTAGATWCKRLEVFNWQLFSTHLQRLIGLCVINAQVETKATIGRPSSISQRVSRWWWVAVPWQPTAKFHFTWCATLERTMFNENSHFSSLRFVEISSRHLHPTKIHCRFGDKRTKEKKRKSENIHSSLGMQNICSLRWRTIHSRWDFDKFLLCFFCRLFHRYVLLVRPWHSRYRAK